MANVKQTQKMVPLITCEISLCQYVSELVFGVNVFDSDFWVQIDSIKKPIKSNSVGSGNMSQCRLLPFMIILITASLSSKIYNTASLREEFAFDGTQSTLFRSKLSCLVGALVCFLVRLLDVVRCNKSTCANESLFFRSVLRNNGTLL